VEGTNQQTAAAIPTSSANPTSVAPNLASTPAISAPSTFQASTAQAPASPQVPTYQPTAAQPASAPVADPWQTAFQALSASVNQSNQYQAPAQYSAYQTPTPQAPSQAAWVSPQATLPQAQPIYSAQVSTPAYTAQQVQQLLDQQQAQIAQPLQTQEQDVAVRDGYLSQISDESLEVLEHFGAEAPAMLNTYACAVEDALIEQVRRGQALHKVLNAAGEERAAMNILLTNPDYLADYVNEFFGPEGPYPTETLEETAEREQLEARQQFEAEIQAQEQRGVPANFQRPTMDMPTPNQAQGNAAANWWGDFSELMDTNPEQAWQYLAQAPNGALQTKMLVQDL
jgi:hypothetical protein